MSTLQQEESKNPYYLCVEYKNGEVHVSYSIYEPEPSMNAWSQIYWTSKGYEAYSELSDAVSNVKKKDGSISMAYAVTLAEHLIKKYIETDVPIRVKKIVEDTPKKIAKRYLEACNIKDSYTQYAASDGFENFFNHLYNSIECSLPSDSKEKFDPKLAVMKNILTICFQLCNSNLPISLTEYMYFTPYNTVDCEKTQYYKKNGYIWKFSGLYPSVKIKYGVGQLDYMISVATHWIEQHYDMFVTMCNLLNRDVRYFRYEILQYVIDGTNPYLV